MLFKIWFKNPKIRTCLLLDRNADIDRVNSVLQKYGVEGEFNGTLADDKPARFISTTDEDNYNVIEVSH